MLTKSQNKSVTSLCQMSPAFLVNYVTRRRQITKVKSR